MQYWGFLEGAGDFKARSTAKEHTNEIQSGGRDPGVSRPVRQALGYGQTLCRRFSSWCIELLSFLLCCHRHRGVDNRGVDMMTRGWPMRHFPAKEF